MLTTPLYSQVPTEEAAFQLAEDLMQLETSAQTMQMHFHLSKCKVMHQGRNKLKYQYTMKTEDGAYHTLENTSVEKDLGVHIDKALKFTAHCQQKINIANKMLGCLHHTFKNMDTEIFKMLYKALVRPHLEFSSCIWSPQHKFNKDSIERVQRRATKMVPSIKHLPYSERLKELDLGTLYYRRISADLLEIYRITPGLHAIDQDYKCSTCPEKTMLQPSLSSANRGHRNKL